MVLSLCNSLYLSTIAARRQIYHSGNVAASLYEEDIFVVLSNVQTSHATTDPSTPHSGVGLPISELHNNVELHSSNCFRVMLHVSMALIAASQSMATNQEVRLSDIIHYPCNLIRLPVEGSYVCSRRSMQTNELSAWPIEMRNLYVAECEQFPYTHYLCTTSLTSFTTRYDVRRLRLIQPLGCLRAGTCKKYWIIRVATHLIISQCRPNSRSKGLAKIWNTILKSRFLDCSRCNRWSRCHHASIQPYHQTLSRMSTYTVISPWTLKTLWLVQHVSTNWNSTADGYFAPSFV